MEVYLIESRIQFKNPNTGQPTRAVAEHYNGRRVIAIVDGLERTFMFEKNELPFESDQNAIVLAIIQKLEQEKQSEQEE